MSRRPLEGAALLSERERKRKRESERERERERDREREIERERGLTEDTPAVIVDYLRDCINRY